MADIERRTRLARLLIAPASFVYDELKRYGAEVQASPYTAQSDQLEQALADRNDPLIDLGLAAYGANRELVGELYRKGKAPASDEVDATYKQGLRLAVLANETIDAKGFLSRFPENVIGEAELGHVLKEAEWIEAETLILNPTIADDVLLAVYRNDEMAEGIDETRRRELVSFSGRNGRLNNSYDNEHGPDMNHYYLHKAIFEMLRTVPTSKGWLWTLSHLLSSLAADQVSSQGNIDAVLERWKVDENGAHEKPRENDRYNSTGLPDREEFRCLVAALYGKHYGSKQVIIQGSFEHEDVARRCAFYANGKLDKKLIKEGYEKDGDAFVFAAMMNDDVFLNKQLRKLFEEECLNGSHTHRYRERCEQLHQRRKWFDPRPTAEWMTEVEPKTLEDATERRLGELNVSVRRLEKMVGQLPWFIIVLGPLLLLLLWRT